MKVAITVWGQRISPVFDAAQSLLVVEIQDGEIVERKAAVFQTGQFDRFVQLLNEMQVRTLICGALCAGPAGILESHGIRVISFIAGESENILQLFIEGKDLKEFVMPGCGWKRCCRIAGR